MVSTIRKADRRSQTYADPPPKLRTLKSIRKAKKLKEELYGEGKKKVTLPTFSFQNKDK